MYKSDHIEKAAQDFWAKEKCFESSEETTDAVEASDGDCLCVRKESSRVS